MEKIKSCKLRVGSKISSHFVCKISGIFGVFTDRLCEVNSERALIVLSTLFILACGSAALARTSLVALPTRQETMVKLGTKTQALVQEKRVLTLKKGNNKIDFSWQNVMIDPSSIQLMPFNSKTDIKLLSVSYPPGESALVWDIYSSKDVSQKVVISYLLANIDGLTTYLAVADTAEEKIQLKSFMVLRNFSGENFKGANISINNGKPFKTTIDHLETKRLLVSETKNIPIKKVYTWDAVKMPHDPQESRMAVGIPVSYELQNTAKSNLGHSTLTKGKVRLFQNDQKGGAIFLGEDIFSYTPVGDKTNLHIGDSRDIVVTRKILDSKRSNIQRNTKGKIQVFDEDYDINIVVENLKNTPVTLSIIETIPGQWELADISMEYKRIDHQTLRFNVALLSKQKTTLKLKYKVLNIFAGSFSRYNRVR